MLHEHQGPAAARREAEGAACHEPPPEEERAEGGTKGNVTSAVETVSAQPISQCEQDPFSPGVTRIACVGIQTRSKGKRDKELGDSFAPAYIGAVMVGGRECRVCVADCGACTSIISKAVLVNLPSAECRYCYDEPTSTVQSIDGSTVVLEGQVEVTFDINGSKFVQLLSIVDGGAVILLGMDFLCKHQAVIVLGLNPPPQMNKDERRTA